MKLFITFGQVHVHSINGLTLDKDCIAEFEFGDIDKAKARNEVMKLIGPMWHNAYDETEFDQKCYKGLMDYFPRGVVKVT